METTRIEKTGQYSWRVTNEDGVTISSLMLKPDGEVEWVGTHPRYRRKGYARALWEHVASLGLNPRHSPCRYPEGDAWARAVGGEVPALHLTPCAVCSTI